MSACVWYDGRLSGLHWPQVRGKTMLGVSNLGNSGIFGTLISGILIESNFGSSNCAERSLRMLGRSSLARSMLGNSFILGIMLILGIGPLYAAIASGMISSNFGITNSSERWILTPTRHRALGIAVPSTRNTRRTGMAGILWPIWRLDRRSTFL